MSDKQETDGKRKRTREQEIGRKRER